jgi:hypothetical protein
LQNGAQNFRKKLYVIYSRAIYVLGAARVDTSELQTFDAPLYDSEGLSDRAFPPKSRQIGNVQQKFGRGDP